MKHPDTQDCWYSSDKGTVHERVFRHVQQIQDAQSDNDRKWRDLARFYSNRQEPGIHGSRGLYRDGWGGVTENLIASVIDTATALVAKTTPKVSVMTDGADWGTQKTARMLEKYVAGQFSALDVYDKMAMMFRDACIFGTGIMHAYVHKSQVYCERVLPTEIVVDEETCNSDQKPLEVHRVRLMNKVVLASKFKKHTNEIFASDRGVYELRYTSGEKEEQVAVVESWRLPVGDTPGRYSMVVQNATLVDEEYTAECFPFVFYRWQRPLTGFYGQALAEGLIGYQVRLNDLNDFIQECQDLVAVPRVFVEAGSKLLKSQLDNAIGRIIPYAGQRPPTFYTPQAVTAEIYNYKEQIKTNAFEFAGISKMAAQATRPQGIEAAVALRELSDNQSQRFAIQQRQFEGAHIELAKLLITLIRGMDSKPRVYLSGEVVEAIDWPTLDFSKNKYVFNLQPSSILGDTPAGRLQKVIELAQYGVPVDPNVMQKLLSHPDLELEDTRNTSALEHAEWVIDKLTDGEFVPPDSYMNLEMTLNRVRSAMLEGIRKKAPEDTIELMRQFIIQGQELLTPPQPPMDPALAGNVAEGALPGVVDPTQADAAGTMLSGLGSQPLATQ